MALFKSVANKQQVIVPWARYEEPIPLRCVRCGAVFITRNIMYVGATTVYYGDDTIACHYCNRVLGHGILSWKPDRRLFEAGKWE